MSRATAKPTAPSGSGTTTTGKSSGSSTKTATTSTSQATISDATIPGLPAGLRLPEGTKIPEGATLSLGMATVAAASTPDGLPTIEFVQPMPGFPNHTKFVLVRLDDDGMLYALTSAEDPNLRFIVVPPPPFFPDYSPEIDDETLGLLEYADADSMLLLLVITAGESTKDSTANLMAPIVIDQRARRAVQAVLSGSGLPVRANIAATAAAPSS